MALPDKQSIESFIIKLSVITGGVVLLFSVLNGYQFQMIMVRTILSFLFMFLLGKGFIILWEKLSPPRSEKKKDYFPTIDVTLGDHETLSIPSKEDGNAINTTNKDDETAPSGTYSGAIPGQINIDMTNGLQDSENKAEIVRRMGWEKE